MLRTIDEQLIALASQIQGRRVMLNLSQKEAAERSGVAYRTWRRLETEGRASLEDLVRAANVLRCEEGLAALFPLPSAKSLDELLVRQARDESSPRPRQRVRRRRQ